MEYDVGFAISSTASPEEWTKLTSIFIPGKGRPRQTGPGCRVFLKHQDRLYYSYVIVKLAHKENRISSIDGQDFGSGWVFEIRSGQEEDLKLHEVSSKGGGAVRWGQGIRYLKTVPPLLA